MTQLRLILLLVFLVPGCADPADPTDARDPDVAADVDLGPDTNDRDDAATQDAADGAGEDLGPDLPPPEPGEAPMFADGCPDPGRASARVWSQPGPAMIGPDARDVEGGWLLVNERAAFAVSPIDDDEAYWYYGGILVDAVAVDGCRQAGAERFEELVPLLGHLDPRTPSASVLRGFRGERGEVLSDGSDGGPAVVRVHGVDDLFWLVELELVALAFETGNPKSISSPLGIRVAVDYILDPGASQLRVEMHVTNLLAQRSGVITGAAIWFGDTTEAFYHGPGGLGLAGFHIDADLPWIAAHGRDASLAISIPGAATAALSVSGVRSMLDASKIVGSRLGPAGDADETFTDTYLVAVGAGGANHATRHLAAFDARLDGSLPIDVRVTDPDGEAIEGAQIDIARKAGDSWGVYDRDQTDATGTTRVELVHALATDDRYRLSVRVAGRASPAPVEFTYGTMDAVVFEVAHAGQLTWAIRDTGGEVLPARIALWNEGGRQFDFYADSVAEGAAPLPPGAYAWQVWRGYEYGIVTGDLTVTPEAPGRIEVTLERLVDTTGYLSMDSHLHAGPSPDSDVSVPDRLRTAAAAGLEIPVSTDHEFVADWSESLPETGLAPWVRPVIGQEVTATLPEHMNMYPVPKNTEHARGKPVRWYGLDPAGSYAAIRDRGAGVVQLNHPKQGCNYMCLIDWRADEARPGLEDPTLLGFSSEQSLWSWDFDAVELYNGFVSPFLDPNSPHDTGLFDDWYNWHLAGHRITAMAVTDAHGAGPPGSPRTLFLAPTDDPAQFEDEMMTDAITHGRAQTSAGAFARVSVGGATLGATAEGPDGEVVLDIEIQAIPEVHVGWVTVFVDCDEVAAVAATDPDGVVKLQAQVPLSLAGDAAIVVAAFSPRPMPRGFDNYNARRTPRVMTNPIYVDVDGNGTYDPPGPKTCTYSLAAP